MENAGADLTKTVKHKSNTPNKDSDLSSLGLTVAAKWKVSPLITLIWTNAVQHETNVNLYTTTLNERQSTGGGRKEKTIKLKALDASIDEGIAAIKGYLVYKYEKNNAPSFYPQFGIERVGKILIIPRDRNKRQKALPLILEAVTAHGFTNEKYGTAFWQATKDSYDALLKEASTVDGTVAKKVSDKNELRKIIVKTHNSLICVLKANYPDTYKNVIREWGFQKEKY